MNKTREQAIADIRRRLETATTEAERTGLKLMLREIYKSFARQ